MPDTEPSWGVRTNEREWSSRSDAPIWATRYQRDGWREAGLVLWDYAQQQVTHLPASCAHRLLEHLGTEAEWRQAGLVVGTQVYEIRLDDPAAKAQWILVDKMSLDPDQCSYLLDVLTDHERVLEEIEERDAEDLRRRLSAIYQRLLGLPPWGQAGGSDAARGAEK